MPEQHKKLDGGTLKVKVKVGVQYINHGTGGAAVLDSTGVALDQDSGDLLSYVDGAGQTHYLNVDSSDLVVFTTGSGRAWTETGSGTGTRVATTVGAATKMINVDPAGAPIVDGTGAEAYIEEA